MLGAAYRKSGYESTHVNHLGLAGAKDWELRKIIIEDDWTFVANNSIDFRGPDTQPGSTGEYADVHLHAGLVCIHAPSGMNLDMQRRLFDLILDDLDEKGDLTNQVLEVSLKKSGKVILRRTSLPENI